MSDHKATRVHRAERACDRQPPARLSEAVKFAVAISLGAALLLSHQIYSFAAHGTNFAEALVSAVQLSQGFYPPP